MLWWKPSMKMMCSGTESSNCKLHQFLSSTRLRLVRLVSYETCRMCVRQYKNYKGNTIKRKKAYRSANPVYFDLYLNYLVTSLHSHTDFQKQAIRFWRRNWQNHSANLYYFNQQLTFNYDIQNNIQLDNSHLDCLIICEVDGVIIIILAQMRRNITNLIRHFLAVERKGVGYKVNQHFQQSVDSGAVAKQTKKVSQGGPYKRPSPQTQLYNSNLSYDCGSIFAKFLLLGPYHQRSESNTKVSIKTKTAMSIRCIEKEHMYTKGSSYTMIDLTLRDVNRLLSTRLNAGQQFKLNFNTMEQEKWLRIFVQGIGQQQNSNEKDQQKQANTDKEHVRQQWPKQMQQIIDAQKTKSNSDPESVKFQIKSSKAQYQFEIPYAKFQSILKLIQESLPCLYGVESAYELELNKLVGMFERGEIKDEEEEFDPNRFSL